MPESPWVNRRAPCKTLWTWMTTGMETRDGVTMRVNLPMVSITGTMIMILMMTSMVMKITTTMVFTMTTLTARVIITMKRTASSQMRKKNQANQRKTKRIHPVRRTQSVASTSGFQKMTFGTIRRGAMDSMLSTSTWLPLTSKLQLPRRPQPVPRTQSQSQVRQMARTAVRMRQISTACMEGEDNTQGDTNRLDMVVARHADTQLARRNVPISHLTPISQLKPTSQSKVTKVNVAIAVTVVLNRCLPIPRPNNTSCQLTSRLTLLSKASAVDNTLWSPCPWSSNSHHSTTDTAHLHQPAATVAAEPANSSTEQLLNPSSSSSQSSNKAADSARESSRDVPLQTRKSSLLRMTLLALSSSRSTKKAVKSHFLCGVETARRKSARAARNAKRSGSHSAHLALL